MLIMLFTFSANLSVVSWISRKSLWKSWFSGSLFTVIYVCFLSDAHAPPIIYIILYKKYTSLGLNPRRSKAFPWIFVGTSPDFRWHFTGFSLALRWHFGGTCKNAGVGFEPAPPNCIPNCVRAAALLGTQTIHIVSTWLYCGSQIGYIVGLKLGEILVECKTIFDSECKTIFDSECKIP